MSEKYYKTLLGAIVISAMIIVGFVAFNTSPAQQTVGGNSATAVDLIGTRVGTTTTGVAFYSSTTPITYRKFIGSGVDEVTLNLQNTAIGSHAANTYINIYGSNDAECDVSSSTQQRLNTGSINWYDIGTSLKDLAGSATIAAATTTLSWTPTAIKQGKQIILTNLNVNCIRVDVAATSTTLYGQLRYKQN